MSPPDNIFALPAKVFSSCLAIVSAVMVGSLFLWPALRYRTGYQTVLEIWPSAETPSNVHFQLTHVHSTLDLFGRCTLQIDLLTYLLYQHTVTCWSHKPSKPWQSFPPTEHWRTVNRSQMHHQLHSEAMVWHDTIDNIITVHSCTVTKPAYRCCIKTTGKMKWIIANCDRMKLHRTLPTNKELQSTSG